MGELLKARPIQYIHGLDLEHSKAQPCELFMLLAGQTIRVVLTLSTQLTLLPCPLISVALHCGNRTVDIMSRAIKVSVHLTLI